MSKNGAALSIVLAAALGLAACESAPPKSEPPKPAPAAPREASPAPARPQQAAPEAESEGMTVYELQDRLAALGYKLGTVDGVLGPRTVDALKKFQSDKNLAVTGTINAETIRALRTAKP
ncbi:MAG TPA: peptidoglycan-binding domain-containing protein [Casimicrobiaceae bacterium]|nr:peptidoglycan-binding domain-containing protein [Casimicrobiaceae bacterium]